MKNFKYLALLPLLLTLTNTTYAAEEFSCPSPSAITVVDLKPYVGVELPFSLWLTPELPGKSNGAGLGAGGTQVGAFIGSAPVMVNDNPGWECLYKSSEHSSAAKLQSEMNQLPPEAQRTVSYLTSQGVDVGMVAYQAK